MSSAKSTIELRKRSITELRGIAQAIGCKFTFADDVLHLAQKIELKQRDVLPPPEPIVVVSQGDQRLRTLPPAKRTSEEYVWTMLAPFIERGLKFYVDEDGFWEMRLAEKMDTGNLRCPPRHILRAAERMLQP